MPDGVIEVDKNNRPAMGYYDTDTGEVEEVRGTNGGINTKGQLEIEAGPINVQHPLPSNGDSIYVKDLDIDNCDNGNFSGLITDYFDSLKTINSDTTSNNPKIIKLWFNRTIYSHGIGFGCDDLAKGFGTSITIKLLGSGESVRFTKTFTTIDQNSFLAEFGPKVFNGLIMEFNTVNEVCLSNLTIAKSVETNATLHGLDPDGNIQEVGVTADGNLTISDNSNGLSIAQGNVIGTSFIHKFGGTPDFDTGDGDVTVWDGANDGGINEMQYNYSTTAAIDSISSSDNGDTQNIEVQGLDANYNLIIQTVQLLGQTKVPLSTNLIRVFRLKNVGSVDVSGQIYCYEDTAIAGGTPTDTTKIRAGINNGNNQTLMAIFTIPAGYTGYMRDWYVSGAKSSASLAVGVKLLARPFGQVFQLKHQNILLTEGTSYIKHNYTEPEVFAEKTDIEIRANTSANVTSVYAGFDIVLVEN